ncbi:LacI family DNA-binding transcriptional regulator [Halobacillus karajensis]|uniref:HTH-type transcriptional repressor CytR n=1 Tax=Halobacillus karajensis TaxID=195088 RepID=A0A024P3Y2_9BACI|nr:LacI family DNA-binding transcriptional regulator [Halobacillus karajensis]CDQ19096.1 HTH-type transcriptional repressor CytR [Halobacillus karajensis]CDQ22830.1 HTH-type transcriptional repressor CytR [Halobacillus karajensis]CDQ26312.1 HTH-type transcriptional repressor CytR [Halobacillus karajensis]
MPKMSDVARLAGVSTATVSRVLRNPDAVKTGTKEKVLEAIHQLNYQPNMLARHFRRTETKTILVLVPNIINTVFAEIVGGIEEQASKNGYRVLLRNTARKLEREYGSIEHLKQRQVDGMIMLSPQLDEATLNEISSQFPIVLATANLETPKIPFVSIDNVSSSYKATEHLIRLGHKKVGHITGPMDSLLSRHRNEGYRKALGDYGLDIDEQLVRRGHFSYESGFEQMMDMLGQNHVPTAVFAPSDEMAIGIINAAKEHQLRIPEDLAVVGFDNIRFASMFNPSLTTIAQPLFKMGQRSMELLLKKLNGESISQTEHLLPDELIIRDSCGARKKGKLLHN